MEEKSTEAPIPAEMKAAVTAARARLMEEAATGDEALMMKFLDSGELTVAEIRRVCASVWSRAISRRCSAARRTTTRASRKYSTRSWISCPRLST